MKLLPELVPQSAWNSNLHTMLPKHQWDTLRNQTYKRANYQCEICGGKGKTHPVECHEIWQYNEQNGVQKLVKLISLCPACHQVKHIGLASKRGQLNQALKHMCEINGFTTKEQVQKVLTNALTEWQRLSKRDWTLDISAIDKGREDAK